MALSSSSSSSSPTISQPATRKRKMPIDESHSSSGSTSGFCLTPAAIVHGATVPFKNFTQQSQPLSSRFRPTDYNCITEQTRMVHPYPQVLSSSFFSALKPFHANTFATPFGFPSPRPEFLNQISSAAPRRLSAAELRNEIQQFFEAGEAEKYFPIPSTLERSKWNGTFSRVFHENIDTFLNYFKIRRFIYLGEMFPWYKEPHMKYFENDIELPSSEGEVFSYLYKGPRDHTICFCLFMYKQRMNLFLVNTIDMDSLRNIVPEIERKLKDIRVPRALNLMHFRTQMQKDGQTCLAFGLYFASLMRWDYLTEHYEQLNENILAPVWYQYSQVRECEDRNQSIWQFIANIVDVKSSEAVSSVSSNSTSSSSPSMSSTV